MPSARGLTQALGRMEDSIARLLDHYANVSDGTSALLRDDLLSLCCQHSISESAFCEAFALALADRYARGALDAERAAFAADDLLVATDFNLTPFARRVFDLLEYCESSPEDAFRLLRECGPGTAA